MKIKRITTPTLTAYRYIHGSKRPEEMNEDFVEYEEGSARVGGLHVIYGDYVVLDEDNTYKKFTTEEFREKFQEEK